jgi:hypothetical protein
VLALSFATVTPSRAAGGAYEPNDSIASAAGPLLAGAIYTAELERPGDSDLFYFHITSATSTRTEVNVANVGGGGASTDLSVTILDSEATPIAGQSYIGAGGSRLVSTALEPQKYFLRVSTGEGFGDAYSLTLGGAPGAFGPYSQIAGRCAAATSAAARAQTRRSAAEARRQRAVARLRRSRHQSRVSRERAQAAYRKARKRLRTARHAVRTASHRQDPWCSIAP